MLWNLPGASKIDQSHDNIHGVAGMEKKFISEDGYDTGVETTTIAGYLELLSLVSVTVTCMNMKGYFR